MTTGPIAVGTIFANNYVSFARVLAESFHRHHPDVPFVGVLADKAHSGFRPGDEPFQIIELAELNVPSLDRLAFRYSRLQLSVALKSYLLERLLSDGYESALFLDVDTLVLGDLGDLLDRTRASAITLVPHLLNPLDRAERAPRELNILQSGVLNGGVVGVSNCGTARRFLAWWRDRVYWDCRYSLGEGIHYDQRWLDLTAAFFSDVHLFRDPRVNVAHWNLPERLAAIKDWRLFHFSGYRPDEPDQVTHYSRRVVMTRAIRPLFSRYQRALESAGWEDTKAWPYAYGEWDNGVRIPDVVRELYADLREEAVRFGDPFRTASADSFFRWLTQPLDGDRALTRLWAGILRHRPDVQIAFPDPLGADRDAFLTWTQQSGVAEHDIPKALLRG